MFRTDAVRAWLFFVRKRSAVPELGLYRSLVLTVKGIFHNEINYYLF